MSIPDSDDAAAVPADYVRTRTFDRVRRGYDPDQVREYLDRIADRLKWTERRLAELEGEVEAHRQPGGPYRPLGNFVADILKAASEKAEEVLAAAKHDAADLREKVVVEADEVRAQAAHEAARMRSDAAAEAREMLEQAHTASNHLTSDAIHHIHRTRETLVQAHSQFQRMRSGVVEQLQAFTDSMLLLEEQIVAALATLESEHAQLGHLSMPAVSPANEGRGLGLYMPSEQEEQPWVMFVPDEARQTIAGQ